MNAIGFGFSNLVDRRDIRMIERRQGAGLALEARQPLGARGELLRQDLDCHLASELRVLGAIYRPHTTLAKLGGDFEVRKSLADHVSVAVLPVEWGSAGHCTARADASVEIRDETAERGGHATASQPWHL